MNYLSGIFLLFLSFFNILFSSEWSHLELGAGNYGLDGHTKTALRKTFLMKIMVISDARSFIDSLEETGCGNFKPEEQYAILFWTLDQLVDRFGDTGIFHVNDLCQEYAAYAAQRLQEYATSQGYHSVIIEAIPGDYQMLDSQSCLSRYGKTEYSSVHLKNPEASFYFDKMDGDFLLTSEENRLQTRTVLQHLANLSEEGLYFFIPYHEDYIPAEERKEFMEKQIFYQPSEQWEPVPYIAPEGPEALLISKENGKVFFIEAVKGS